MDKQSMLLLFLNVLYITSVTCVVNQAIFDNGIQTDEPCQEKCNLKYEDFVLVNEKIYTEPFVCFAKCRLIEEDLMSEDGTIYPELIKKYLYRQSLPEQYLEKNIDCLDKMPSVATYRDFLPVISCLME